MELAVDQEVLSCKLAVECVAAEGKVSAYDELLRARDVPIQMKGQYQSRIGKVTILEKRLGELGQEHKQLHQAQRIEKFWERAAKCALLNARNRLALLSSSVCTGQHFLEGRFESNLEHLVADVVECGCGETESF